MTSYNPSFSFPIISPPQSLDNVLSEWISRKGLKQRHIAETEKYAHVTFFFNGGREQEFHLEERRLIASPKVATYDLLPEMSSHQVADAVIEGLKDQVPFVMCNFAPPDMVGHTGKYEPTIRAVQATDLNIGRIYEACKEQGYILVVTADHGNAEQMLDEQGNPFTAHTCNKVPLIITSSRSCKKGGALCDVAPTILDLMGLEKPLEMTGNSLLE